jgi:hypothetical protein
MQRMSPCADVCVPRTRPLILLYRAGTGVVVAALYYQSANKDSHAKDKPLC